MKLTKIRSMNMKQVIVLIIFLNAILFSYNCPVLFSQAKVEKVTLIINGVVLDEQNKGVHNADVIIPQRNISIKTDRSGRFELRLKSGGKVHVEVYKNGFLTASTEVFETNRQGEIKRLTIVLQRIPFEEVVVTGTLSPKLYSETPVKTALTTRKDIEKKGATSLADSLELVTGVRVENNCQNCNFNQVRINGMEGKYSQILINGLPIISALAGVYALEQIPANMIEKLEVVKGGGAALYGGNAVAGVVNVITRQPKKTGTQISFNQSSINSEPFSVANFNTDYVSPNYTTSVSFFTNYQDRDHMDYNGDNFSDLGELKNLSLGANLYNDFNSINGKLKLSFASIFEDRRGGNKFDLPEHMADIAESIRTYRTDLGLGWEQTLGSTGILCFEGSVSYTKRKTYYGAEQDPNAYGQTLNPVFYGIVTYNHLSFHGHNILLGTSFKSDKIEDQISAYNRIINETYTDLGVFLQDEIELFHHQATLLAGLRLDKHSEIETLIVSPRASFLYKGIKNLTFRATFSTGFRAPQVFDEDLHITQVGGEGMLIVNCDGLQEEKSHSFTLDIDYGKQVKDKLYQFSISGFYNHLDNVFTLKEIDPTPNARVFERFNSEGAKVYGIQFEAGFKWKDRFEIFTGWTFQRSLLDEPEPDFNSKDFFRTPDVYGSLRIDWNIPKFVNILGEMNYTGPMKVPHFAGYIETDMLETTRAFAAIDLSVRKNFSLGKDNQISIVASVLNVFDEFQQDLDCGIFRDAGYVYGPRFPRTFRIGFEYNF
jgi:outer membrane receptor for ferrienterochelin and colicins